ncbi:hypothetical protein BFJ70_g16862 [Fusarium oxysporum]|nr:hypothetical protein BFJ70_g16862 [Fusarium oxysporum]
MLVEEYLAALAVVYFGWVVANPVALWQLIFELQLEREMDALPETEQHLRTMERVIELNKDAAVELEKQIEAIGGHEV